MINLNLLTIRGQQWGPDSQGGASFHARVKHIDVRYHYVRECADRGEIVVSYIQSNDNIADGFTKALDSATFQRVRKNMGLS